MSAQHSADPHPGGHDAIGKRTPAGSGSVRLLIAACVLAGLAARLGLVHFAPRYAFLWDHIDFMVWSDWAYERGPTTLYDLPVNRLINVHLPPPYVSQPTVEPYPNLNAFNYPPLSGYLFWVQGCLWQLVDRVVLTKAVGPELARYPEFSGRQVTSRVVNTVKARAVNAAVPVLADFLMAWGVLRLVRVLRRARPASWVEVWAFALTILGPPILLNSAFWTQMDSCLMCLLVWCVYLLATGRRVWAGACFGAALMTKAQAILLLPVLAFVFLGLTFVRGGSLRQGLQLWKAALAGLVVAGAVAAPYALANRAHPEGGWLRWYYRAYQGPIRQQYPYTTLKAFNLWWLDFMGHKQEAAALDAAATVWPGVTKERAGQVLLGAAVVAGAVLCAWRWNWEHRSWVAYASVVLLAAFVWPTRVHDRYIYYCQPFLIAAAVVFRPWIPLLLAVFCVGGFELTWFLWLAPPDADFTAPAQSPAAAAWSLMLAILTVASCVYAYVALLPWRRRAKPVGGADVGRSASLFGEPAS